MMNVHVHIHVRTQYQEQLNSIYLKVKIINSKYTPVGPFLYHHDNLSIEHVHTYATYIHVRHVPGVLT